MKTVKASIMTTAMLFSFAHAAFAADWTDADGNEYTALKYIKGNGSGTTGGPYIITDFKPVANSTVKLRFKPTTVENTECLFCSRKKASNKVSNSMSGFRINNKIRLDRYHTTRYETCDTTSLAANNDYSLSADFKGGTTTSGIATINGIDQTLSDALGNTAYTPASKLTLFASHEDENVSASSTFSYKGSFYLYYFQLYSPNDGSLAHNLMPAKNSSGVAGLYDTVTRTFYGPTGPSGYETFATEAYADRAGKKWTGLGADNKMSTAENWENNDKPAAGDDVDFTLAAPFAAIVGDIDATFGKIYLGAGDLPAFSGTLAATAISDLTRMQDYDTATEGFTFTLDAPSGQDFTWNGGTAANWSTTDALWLYNSAASVWCEYNNAIFTTVGATATLTEDATANSVVFNQNATVDGTATLSVTNVSVAAEVAATISAPTAGSLTKTGAGTLTLTQNRTAATTVTEGTLTMDGATIADLTLGTDGGAPVTFDYGGQVLVRNPQDYLVTGSTVTLTNGIFSTVNGADLSIRDDMSSGVLPSVLTIAKGATLRETTAANGVYICKGGNGSSTINIAGGVLEKTSGSQACYIQHKAVSGCVNINATEGGLLSFPGNVNVLCGGNIAVTSPSLYMTLSDSTFSVGGTFNFGSYYPTASNVPTTPTGVFAATNSVVSVGGDGFIVGRNTRDAKTAGSYTVEFENGVVTAKTFAVYYDRPLNNARFNGTRFVFGAANGSLAASDGEDNWFTVGADGMTIDTQDYSATLNANLGGPGAATKTGEGTLVIARNQTATAALVVGDGTLSMNSGVSIARAVSVADGATLTVNTTAGVGSLSLAAGSTLNIASYDGTTPLAVQDSATLPESGTVNLTLNGGAFGEGVYAIYSASGVTAADGGKFTFATTDNQTGTWSVADGTLLLTVDNGGISGNYWIGRAGDGKMSTAANWLNGVPAEGDDIDFSGVSSDVTIYADTDRAFGTVTMGGGVVTFTISLTVAAFSDLLKVAVAAGSTVTIDGDVTLDKGGQTLCKTIAASGMLRITGLVEISHSSGEVKAADIATSGAGAPGAIMVEGGIAVKTAASVVWNAKTLVLGADGISFTRDPPFYFTVEDPEVYSLGATTVLGTGGKGLFRTNNDDVFLCTTQYGSDQPAIITFDGNFNGSSGYWSHWRVTGCGRVVCTSAAQSNRGLRVYDGATLAFNPNTATFGQSDQTFHVYNEDSGTAGGTLEVASSGTVTLTGNLSLKDGAALGFNFTDRSTPPQLALSSGKTLTASGAVTVKVSATGIDRPKAGEYVLTTCGGFDAEGVTVSLAEGAPKWVNGLSVNTDGNLVIDVKPKGLMIIFK